MVQQCFMGFINFKEQHILKTLGHGNTDLVSSFLFIAAVVLIVGIISGDKRSIKSLWEINNFTKQNQLQMISFKK